MGITKLDVEKAVDDAIRNAESDDKRTLDVAGSITRDELRAQATAEVGKGWSVSAVFRRFRKHRQNEFGVGFSKDF